LRPGEHVIEADVQCPTRRDPRVELPHRSRGSISRVGKERLADASQAVVERCEVRSPHQHLATDGEHPRRRYRGAPQPQRYGADRAHVGGHVFAAFSVASRRRGGESSVPVHHFDRQTIELGFKQVSHRCMQRRPHAYVELPHRVGVARRIEAEHRRVMRNRTKALAQLAADALRRRLCRDEIRKLRFDPEQLLHQRVVRGVADRGPVQHVVSIVMVLDLLAQSLHPPAGLCRREALSDRCCTRCHAGASCGQGRRTERNLSIDSVFRT